MIYSAAFDALPEAVRDRIYRRLFDVLTGIDLSEKYDFLRADTRKAILTIVRETKPGLPEYWRRLER